MERRAAAVTPTSELTPLAQRRRVKPVTSSNRPRARTRRERDLGHVRIAGVTRLARANPGAQRAFFARAAVGVLFECELKRTRHRAGSRRLSLALASSLRCAERRVGGVMTRAEEIEVD